MFAQVASKNDIAILTPTRMTRWFQFNAKRRDEARRSEWGTGARVKWDNCFFENWLLR